jgi:hypothetical protein
MSPLSAVISTAEADTCKKTMQKLDFIPRFFHFFAVLAQNFATTRSFRKYIPMPLTPGLAYDEISIQSPTLDDEKLNERLKLGVKYIEDEPLVEEYR